MNFDFVQRLTRFELQVVQHAMMGGVDKRDGCRYEMCHFVLFIALLGSILTYSDGFCLV